MAFLDFRFIRIKARHPAMPAKKLKRIVKIIAIEFIEPNSISPNPIRIEAMDPYLK